jgi:hypothetical protein
MKISTNYRVVRLLKLLAFVIAVNFKIFPDNKLTHLMLLVFNFFNAYTFISTFTFKNPYHEYLVMIFSFTAIISTLDYIL